MAILLVLLHHAGANFVPGGYTGVDVFFVISGYIITQRLSISGPINFSVVLIDFYERRVRRLLPPLIPVFAACAALAYHYLVPEQMIDFARSLIASQFFVSNWYFAVTSGYFDGPAHLKPLLHMWSLSVEEQFYLVFPIIFLLAKRGGRAKLFVSLLGAASFLVCLWLTLSGSPTAAYFNAFGRFWELAVGAILALIPGNTASSRMKASCSLLGLLLIGIGVTLADSGEIYPGLWLLLPTIGSALIIYAQGAWPNRLLSIRPLVSLGVVSYGLYIWHWPLFVYIRFKEAQPSAELYFAATVVALILAIVSFLFLERPIRSKRLLGRPIQAFILMAMTVVVFSSSATYAITSNGLSFRFESQSEEYLKINKQQRSTFTIGAMRDKCWVPGVERELEIINRFISSCVDVDAKAPRVLIAGDSHAAQYLSALKKAFSEVSFSLLAVDSCTLTGRFDDRNRKDCTAIIDFISRAPAGAFDAVILATRASLQTDAVAGKAYITLVKNLARKTPVYVLGPIQYYEPEMSVIYANMVGTRSASEIESAFDEAVLVERYEYDSFLRRGLATAANVTYIAPLEVLCPTQKCRHFDRDGLPILVDGSHMSLTASEDLIRQIASRFRF